MFSKEQGLSPGQVSEKLNQFGLNILPEKAPPSKVLLIIQQFKSPLVYVLLVAAIITAFIGDYSDAIIITAAVFVNTILGYIQESRASSALYALKKYITNKTKVIRDGKEQMVDTTQIVPGDLVVLNQGARIPADGKFIFVNRLYIDESILTGESLAVTKKISDQALMGTTVTSGQALMIVETTGKSTKMGAIAEQIQKKEEDTPLQKQLKVFSRQLIIIILLLTAAVFIIGILRKFSLNEIFTTSVALAVSSIPEGLLVSLTVVLAIGMQKILKHKALVRKLSAAETLGGVTTICVDKTGTLTQGKMKMVDYVGEPKDLAEQVLLANDLDDPIVIAAFEWGKSIIKNFVNKTERFDSIPFSSKERFFVSLNSWSKDKNMIFVNGAPDHVINWTTLTEQKKEDVLNTINKLTKEGKRVIGLARKEVLKNKTHLETNDAKSGLTWVGLIAFSDPVREGVKQAFEEASLAGIKTIVITGDYAQTSEFVLKELGMTVNETEIMTGTELSKLSIAELSQKVKSIKLFARTTPDQKLMIVDTLRKNGEVVAMMGDGVNDAPALHKADIAIVVGSASDVAKESSDLILLDSNFSTIVSAIEEGRAMFENIRKIILYLLSDAFAEIIVVVGGIAIGLPLPVTAIQILWINLISDGFPGLALTIDPKRADIMKEKPRPPRERLIDKWMIVLIGLVSLTGGIIAFLAFIFVYQTTGDVIIARSTTFLVLGLNSLAYVFSVRTLMTPFWKNNIFENKWLTLAVIAGVGLQIIPFASASLRHFFGLVGLSPLYWLVAAGLSIIMFISIEAFKGIYHLRVVQQK